MLVGYYEHSIDVKGRVKIPEALRETGGGESEWKQFYMAPGPEGCILVYPPDRWRQIGEEASGESVFPSLEVRNFQRRFFPKAVMCKCDGQGRVVIDARLVKHAGLKLGGKVVSVGVHDRIEIWDKERWEQFEQQPGPSFEEAFERMAELCSRNKGHARSSLLSEPEKEATKEP